MTAGISSMTSAVPSSGLPAEAISYADINASFTTPESIPSFTCAASTRAPRRSASSVAISTSAIAIDNSCMSVTRVACQRQQRCLSETDAAIVGRYHLVGPESQAAIAARMQAVQQELILEDTAGEHCRVKTIFQGDCGQ